MKTYTEKLKDPRWQRKRLEIMERDSFKCTQCSDKKSTLNIHHWKYTKNPWDAPSSDLSTVCESCHKDIEFSKKLINSFIKDLDFRLLLKNINRMLQENEVLCKFDDDQILIYKKNDVLSEFDNLIISAPDEDQFYYERLEGFYEGSPFGSVLHNEVFIQWGNGGEDKRVYQWIDSLSEKDFKNLRAVSYNKGAVSLVWVRRIQTKYHPSGDIETPCGDCWNTLESHYLKEL